MGVSTDALLVYGYVWEDEADLLDGADEWEEVIAIQRGLVNPWDAFPKQVDTLPYDERKRQGAAWTGAHQAELDTWYAVKKAIADEYGADLDRHGSDQWVVPIVKIKGAGYRAARGYPKLLTAADLTADPEWDGKLHRFVTDLGIDLSEARGPGWFLVSWWG